MLLGLVMAVISAVLGLISYIMNHRLILGDLEAMIIWFFVSVPSLVVAVIHFIISYVRMSRKVKIIENGKGSNN